MRLEVQHCAIGGSLDGNQSAVLSRNVIERLALFEQRIGRALWLTPSNDDPGPQTDQCDDMHLVIQLYLQQRDADTWAKALGWLERNLGMKETDQALKAFTEEFPPLSIYRNEISIEDYIYGFSQEADGRSIPNRQIILEEMLVLWLANSNPAFSSYLE